MARASSSRGRGRGEPTLPLINVVFLMLVFFLVAATIARPLDRDLRLVKTDDPARLPPSDALVLHEDGRRTWRGQEGGPAEMIAALSAEGDAGPLRIMPDRDAPARALLALAREFHAAAPGRKIVIVTEQGAP